ncbi:DinB family protein [Sediminibacterium soli]|uniref:DinB family protein n=1 Tax=Sediminibacterium soli TaxID=2698829 RepID=UPI00137A1F31|nr:DinB family protein [Sediminibacterium soli]NCI47007.1 DinB family protein [Sediminibacterium soli]
MKKLLLLLSASVLFSFSLVDTISKEERKKATDFLTETKKGVWDATQGLSEAQLKFKPAPDKWSVEDCMKHIAITEQMLWGMVEQGLKSPATPEKRADVKMTDDQVIKVLEDRTNKVKTSAPMEPLNTPYKSMSEAWESFSKSRDKLIEYVNNTNDDLRNHVNALPFASFDSFQMLLFIGAHSNRHMQQMNEVKADPNFPKK